MAPKKKNWFKKLTNKSKLVINKFNPASEENKKIRSKEKTIKSKDSTTSQKSVARTQKSAVIRKRDGVKIADLQAKRQQEMRDRAAAKNKAFKEKQKAFRNRKRK